jgi:3-hydroxyisobutyrate dehydrogenase
MAKIAYLGGGNMGQGMIRRLLHAGHAVTVFNRSPEKIRSLQELGAKLAPSPRVAGEGADAIFSSVSDDHASRLVWTGPEGALSAKLSPETLVIECSTLSHDWVMEIATIVASRSIRYIDCPVAGRPDAAASGELRLFVGAKVADLDVARPLFDPIAKTIFHFGPVGAGTAFKLIYNLMGAVQVAALAEAMVQAETAGIDLHVAAEAFSNGFTGSPHVIRHSAVMAAGKRGQPVAFSGRGRLKDSLYGIHLAEKLGRQAEIGKAAAHVFEQMVNLGMGASNDSELIDALRATVAGRGSSADKSSE